ncbi:MAG: ribosome-associated protein [Eubacteriaceae bacterium]|jgi:ribosome-associated protein|nr:ribosome-associated protein [Eubacteriaceae bacterium]MDN5308166.1 ribosome-associated protein [Eubacteriaceae bacterium]
MEIIEINTEYIKLDQLLKYAAVVGNGSEAKMVILDGLVSVNGQVCTQRNKKIRPEDEVFVEDYGKLIVKGL